MVDKINTNTRYTLYISKCIELAETIVIKLDSVAELMNYLVYMKAGADAVNLSDKTTWKYYQNISGIYHSTDKMMKVNSLDIEGEINFTVENLANNKNTREAYAFGSRYYRELVSLYPDQELLILGILNPININDAVAAPNGKILMIPEGLVETNEYSLVSKLQDWIDKYIFRWDNRQFSISDELYVANFVAQLALNLFKAIVSFRLAACRTNEAHSYHIQQYLASHGFLDYYIDTMKIKQTLFFYRNIPYIERNAGKQDTLDMLIDNTMSVRNLPLYELQVKHNVSDLNKITSLVMEDDQSFTLQTNRQIVPEPIVRRVGVNDITEGVTLNDYTLSRTLTKLEDLTTSNAEYQTDNQTSIVESLTYSDSSVINTKLYESNVVDRTDALMYPITNILYNHWIYLVAKNKYISYIFIELPLESLTLRLSPQEAVGLYMYCTMRMYNANIPKEVLHTHLIPKIRVDRVIRIPSATLDELLSMVDIKKIPRETVELIYGTRNVVNNILTSTDFRQLCEEIFSNSQIQYNIYSSQEDKDAKVYAQAITARLYCDETVVLDELVTTNNQTMNWGQFLDSMNITLDQYDETRLKELAELILKTAILENDNSNTKLENVQKSMVSLMLKLSSYSINVISDINTLPIVIAPVPIVRLNTNKVTSDVVDYVYETKLDFEEASVQETNKYLLTVNDIFYDSNIEFATKSHLDMTDLINVRFTTNPKSKINYRNYDVRLVHKTTFTPEGNFNDVPIDDRQWLYDKLREIDDFRVVRDPLTLNYWLYRDPIIP